MSRVLNQQQPNTTTSDLQRGSLVQQSVEKLQHKTPDFRRYGGCNAYNFGVENDQVIVYSDQDDE